MCLLHIMADGTGIDIFQPDFLPCLSLMCGLVGLVGRES